MTEYTKFPPYNYFVRVLKTCPRSAFIYTQLWKERNNHNKVEVEKDRIRRRFLISPTLFRNILEPLMTMSVLSFEETELTYEIHMNGVEDDK